MKLINKNSTYKWGALEQMPKPLRKCEHQWRELEEGEKGGSPATHECIWCGLEKDEAWNPPMYGYQLKVIQVNEGVTLEDIEIPD